MVPGLREPVEVCRDASGVPHIIAGSARDLFFAQGYVHAEDRLWQMDLMRHACAGRLAELFGDKPVAWEDVSIGWRGRRVPELDLFMRALGLRRAAEAAARRLEGEALEALSAYAAGVTRYIEELVSTPAMLPVELRLVGHKPEPWAPADSLSIGKGMAFQVNFAFKHKLALATVAAKLGGAADPRFRELVPALWPASAPRIVGSAARELAAVEGQLREFVGWAGTHQGSNNWVIAGARTATGKPILAGDPHLHLSAPSIWHLVHLCGGPYDVIGASLPGAPGVVIGHNRRIAWSITNGMADDTDFYLESPADVVETVVEEIRVRGERAPRRHVIRFTPHGPVVSDALARGGGGDGGNGIDALTPALSPRERGKDGDGAPPLTPLIGMRWTAEAIPSGELEAILAVNRAGRWASFVDALRTFKTPAQNFVYADVDGHIGYYLAGHFPIRREARAAVHLPVDGAGGAGDWIGAVPFEELPHLLDPPEGYIATANHNPVPDDYPYYLSEFWEPPYRLRRILKLLREKDRATPEAVAAMQLDVYSIQAEEIVRRLVLPLEDRLKAQGSHVTVALNYLLNWDFRCTPDSGAAAIFHVFYDRLMRDVFEPALGPEVYHRFVETMNEHIGSVEEVVRNQKSTWFEGRDRDELVVFAFVKAVHDLERRLGQASPAWAWGKLHKATMKHAFHAMPVARRLFDVGPFPTGGSGLTVMNGQFNWGRPFEHHAGPSYRQVVDLAAVAARTSPAGTGFVIPTGESGNPASPRYDDHAQLWLEGKLVPMLFDRAKIAELPERLVLEPSGSA